MVMVVRVEARGVVAGRGRRQGSMDDVARGWVHGEVAAGGVLDVAGVGVGCVGCVL